MPKNSKKQSSSPQDLSQPKTLEKPKTVFDHIKHIREVKSDDYYQGLTEAEQKNFNKYVILMGLSMDQNAIEGVNIVSKYLDILPPNAFYKACCGVVPQSNRFCKWIKSSKPKYGRKLLSVIASYYKISKYDAYDYCTHFFANEENFQQLVQLCGNIGYDEEQIEKLMEGEDE